MRVVAAGEQRALLDVVRVPGEAVAFHIVADEAQHWVALAVRVGLASELAPVKHEHFRGGRLCGYEALVLRHVARPVDLPVVVDLLRHAHVPDARRRAHAAHLGLLVVVCARVVLAVLEGQLYFCEHEVVLLAVARVRSEEQALRARAGLVVDAWILHAGLRGCGSA